MSIYTLPYVYRLDNPTTGEFYIGYREANTEPAEIDFPTYRTSSHQVRQTFDNFEWFIVAEFFDATSAYDFEQQLIYENWDNPLLLNKSCYHGKARFKNTGHSEESKRKMSAARMGKSSWNKGVPFSDTVKSKISDALKGRTAWNKGKTGAVHTLITCPHCGKVGAGAIMQRWHFSNCKSLRL